MIIKEEKIAGRQMEWILRCPVEEDAEALSALRVKIDGESENMDRESGEGFLSPEAFREIIKTDRAADRRLFLVAEVDGQLVGFSRCEGKALRRFQHTAEFGICVEKAHWGSGIGSVLLKKILEWADQVGIEKVCLCVVEENEKAIRLYEHYGFEREGLLRRDRLHKDGTYHNTVIMGRFRKE